MIPDNVTLQTYDVDVCERTQANDSAVYAVYTVDALVGSFKVLAQIPTSCASTGILYPTTKTGAGTKTADLSCCTLANKYISPEYYELHYSFQDNWTNTIARKDMPLSSVATATS